MAGLSVEPIRCATYALCGALGGLAGALLAGYFRGANVDIGNEYLLASTEQGFTREELRRLAANSIRASFLPETAKATLLTQIDSTK